MRIGVKSQSVEIKFKPITGTKNFSVRFPNQTLAAFRNLNPDIKADIVESLLPFYKVQRRELDEAKYAPLVTLVEAHEQFSPPSEFSREKWGKYEAATHSRQVKRKVLRLLRFASFRCLAGEVAPMLRLAVSQAIEDNDVRFFKQLGRVLEKQPVMLDPLIEPTPAEQLLIEHWICQNEEAVHLCCFTDQAIDDFLKAVGVGQSLASVRKTRQRLGLKRLPKGFPFTKRVDREKDKIILG